MVLTCEINANGGGKLPSILPISGHCELKQYTDWCNSAIYDMTTFWLDIGFTVQA